MSGLTLGSWLLSKVIDKLTNPGKYFGYFQIIIGFYNGLLILLFSRLPFWFFSFYQMTSGKSFFILSYFLVFLILLIPAMLIGASWPLANKIYISDIKAVGRDTGFLYSLNSLGSILGAIVAGFVLLPLLGVKTSLILAGLVNIIAGLIFLATNKQNKTFKNAIILFLILIPLFFFKYDVKFLSTGFFAILNPELSIQKILADLRAVNIIFAKENVFGLTTVADIANQIKILKINGKTQCSNTPFGIATIQNISRIPIEIFKNNYNSLPKNAFNIGLGCGITAGYFLKGNIQTVTAEINPNVVKAARFFKDINYDILNNKQHELIIEDARKWLFYNSNRKFDIIISQPFDIWQEGSGFMVSKEFFELIKNHLSANGVFGQWVPLYEMQKKDFEIFLKTFQTVFPYFQIYSLGQRKEELYEILLVASQNKITSADSVKNFYIGDSSNILNFTAEITTDNRPILEFSLANHFYKTYNINWRKELDYYFRNN